MAIVKKQERQGKITIDLTGPDGNAFSLMGYANSYGKQLGYTRDEINSLINEMMSGDYENLLQVFDRHFGSVINLET